MMLANAANTVPWKQIEKEKKPEKAAFRRQTTLPFCYAPTLTIKQEAFQVAPVVNVYLLFVQLAQYFTQAAGGRICCFVGRLAA
jgi:hypothetical protein